METLIKVHPSELNQVLLDKIKAFIGDKSNIDLTISIKEYDNNYSEILDRSISEAESGNIISMTLEDFVAYKPTK